MYDVIIIGAGPAGLSAAIYTARATLSTLVIGKIENSNAYKAHIFENYMGFDQPITGPFLMNSSLKQAQRFGTEYLPREIVGITQKTGADGATFFTVKDTENADHEAKTIIICSGLGFKPSGIKREKEFIGKGVSFCVTCDGPFFKNKKTAVIGHTNYAASEALQLLTYTPDVTIISHGKKFEFGEKMAQGIAERNIKTVITPRVVSFEGATVLEKLKMLDDSKMAFEGAFLALGTATAADFANKLGLEKTGMQNAYIKANPTTGQTNVPGIFAAGDCTGGNAQAAKSSGEGCNAALSVIKSLKGLLAYVDYA